VNHGCRRARNHVGDRRHRLYLAHNVRRQQRLKVAELRVEADRELWGHMRVARPTRLEPPESKGPLTPKEAEGLYGEMTTWYFEGGNGMLLPHDTREMYLTAKSRLGRYATQGDGAAAEEGRRRMRELSLLRSQMKSDLDIYGDPYFGLRADDGEFIEASGLDRLRWGRPWYRWASSPQYWLGRIGRRRAARRGSAPSS